MINQNTNSKEIDRSSAFSGTSGNIDEQRFSQLLKKTWVHEKAARKFLTKTNIRNGLEAALAGGVLGGLIIPVGMTVPIALTEIMGAIDSITGTNYFFGEGPGSREVVANILIPGYLGLVKYAALAGALLCGTSNYVLSRDHKEFYKRICANDELKGGNK